MRSSFFELNVAMTGLFTARNGMQVTSHNMANVSTPGFSRQFSKQRASIPLNTFTTTGMVGTGSEAFGVGQIRSVHLDRRYWTERPVLGQQSMVTAQLTIMETMFGELQGTGLTSNFNTFFNGLQDLSTDASDATNRNSVIQSMEVLSRNIQNQAQALLRQQQNINREVSNVVTIINNLGQQISNLNNQISRAEVIGGAANDLRDQRALLIDELSLLVNINVSESHVNGQDRLIIHIDGHEFVNQQEVALLAVRRREPGRVPNEIMNPHDAESLYQIEFANGRPFAMYSPSLSGELRGLIDMRDGNALLDNNEHTPTTRFRGIPYYINRLNDMVRTFSNAFNLGIDHLGESIPGVTAHISGFGADGQTGNALFTNAYGFHSGNSINIFNFQVNPAILQDPRMLATSTDPTLGESSNDLLLGFLEVRTHQSLFREGTLNDFLNAKTGEIAMDLLNSINFQSSQTDVLVVLHNQRLEVKGVDMEEEVTNLIFFQQQFQVASRLISTINEVYDNMINRMGV